MKKLRSWKSWKHRHYGVHALIAAMLVSIAVDWVPMQSPVEKIVNNIGLVAVMAGIVMARAHTYGDLCEDCMEETPLDPERAVGRWRPALKGFHLIQDSRARSWTWFAILMAVMFAPVPFVGSHHPVSKLTADLVILAIIGELLSGRAHSRLQPWCPWCHWRGKGDDEQVQSPAPVAPEVV